jgi:hypothetical protein
MPGHSYAFLWLRIYPSVLLPAQEGLAFVIIANKRLITSVLSEGQIAHSIDRNAPFKFAHLPVFKHCGGI